MVFSLEDILKETDLAIIGNAINDGTIKSKEVPSYYSYTSTDIKIEEVLFGNIKANSITLTQLGLPKMVQAKDEAGV